MKDENPGCVFYQTMTFWWGDMRSGLGLLILNYVPLFDKPKPPLFGNIGICGCFFYL